MKIKNYYSPNFDRKKRLANSIKIIVIHYTGMQSERESIIRLCNPKSKVSSHFLINQKGVIYRLVKDEHISWHAGKSCWGKYRNLNKIKLTSGFSLTELMVTVSLSTILFIGVFCLNLSIKIKLIHNAERIITTEKAK